MSETLPLRESLIREISIVKDKDGKNNQVAGFGLDWRDQDCANLDSESLVGNTQHCSH